MCLMDQTNLLRHSDPGYPVHKFINCTSCGRLCIAQLHVGGSDKTATDTTTLKGKYTESLTFSTPNYIYADYGKLGKPSLHYARNIYNS